VPKPAAKIIAFIADVICLQQSGRVLENRFTISNLTFFPPENANLRIFGCRLKSVVDAEFNQ
jgi:hypothetical protein